MSPSESKLANTAPRQCWLEQHTGVPHSLHSVVESFDLSPVASQPTNSIEALPTPCDKSKSADAGCTDAGKATC